MSKRIGLFGWTLYVAVVDEGDSYGFPGSQGYSVSLTVWKDRRP
jgi:hypothetical protein